MYKRQVLAFTGVPTDEGIEIFGSVPFAFVIFVLILMGVAFYHHYTLYVALAGVAVVTLYTALASPAGPDPVSYTHLTLPTHYSA